MQIIMHILEISKQLRGYIIGYVSSLMAYVSASVDMTSVGVWSDLAVTWLAGIVALLTSTKILIDIFGRKKKKK